MISFDISGAAVAIAAKDAGSFATTLTGTVDVLIGLSVLGCCVNSSAVLCIPGGPYLRRCGFDWIRRRTPSTRLFCAILADRGRSL